MTPISFRALRCFYFLTLFASAAFGAWQDAGTLVATEPQGNQITFRNRQATVVVSVLAPDLIRVRMVPESTPGPDFSWTVVKADWPKVPVEFGGDEGSRIIRTSELEVHVQLSPFRVAFYDRSGRLISKDRDDQGMSWNRGHVRCWKWMPPDEHYFGLGEKSDSLDKRGHAYVEWNEDPGDWYDSSDPLYQSVPFFIALRQGRAYGLFFDNTYRSSFDMGVESPDFYSFGAEGGELNYYFFYGPDPKKVVARYTELVGRSPLPPRWSLGYIQSRASYYPESKVRFIAENLRYRRIPCDSIYFDIEYMDGYKVFVWNRTHFPDPPRMLKDLRQQGFHIITIVEPYIKIDPNYGVYQQGMAGDYFVKKPDGKLFSAGGWPGNCVFPDFASAKVRAWWASLHQGMMKDGVGGIQDDMDEPTVLVPGHLFSFPGLGQIDVGTFDLDVVHHGPQGAIPHSEFHNVYSMMMTAATRQGMLNARPKERPFVSTRSTFAGGQRYAANWTGDSEGTWEHLRLSLPELMTMGLSGLAVSGADTGGFSPVPSPELYTRWLEASAFSPYFWTHSEGPGNVEPWEFGSKLEDINRRSIELRYRLLPYLYDAFRETAETGIPIIRPLLIEYPDDPVAIDRNDEFLFGDDLLVAPIMRDGETRRSLYLPTGVWYDFRTDQRVEGPKHLDVDAPLDRIPVFVRGGAIVPSQQLLQYTDQAPIDPLTFDVYPEGISTREYYEDDGISFDYQHGGFLKQQLTVTQQAGHVRIEISARQGSYAPPKRSLLLKVHAQRTRPQQVEAEGIEPVTATSVEALSGARIGWAYDENANVVILKIPDRGAALTVQIGR